MMNSLHDGTRGPSLRHLIGGLLKHSERADVAISNIRLEALDLTGHETARVHIRILLRRLEADSLHTLNDAMATRIAALRELAESEKVEIRSAGIGDWVPDFSVFHGRRSPPASGDVCLIGAHYFNTPPSATGPSFTCVLTDRTAVSTAATRFDALWELGHDVRSVVREALRRMHSAPRI